MTDFIQQLRTALFLLAVTLSLPVRSVEAADEFQVQRQKTDEQFRQELGELAAKCDELKLVEQAEVSRSWGAPRDPRRQFLFLAPARNALKLPADAPEVVQQWHGKFLKVRVAQAERLFELARLAVENKQATTAYQLLWEVLHENPDHAEARKILGFNQVNKEWRSGAKEPKATPGQSEHRQFGWQRGKHWRIDSEHFSITTNHSAREGIELAQRLGELHLVWRQLFFRFWSTNEKLAARFNGRGDALGKSRPHTVVLFRNREEYLAALLAEESQIKLTTGLYLDRKNTAYFYAEDENVRPTWDHEVTHQLFQEAGDMPDGPGVKQNFWAIEAVALYMESLQRHGDYCTVGGVDADRLQFTRYRTLRNDFYLPLEKLAALGRDDLQKHPEIRRLYGQAAGLAHLLMDGEGGKYRNGFTNYLALIYLKRDAADSLATALKCSPADLDQAYRGFLQVTDEELRHVPQPWTAKNLSLGLTTVSDAGLAGLTDAKRLEWLDLSFTKTSDAGLAYLRNSPKMRQLFLEKTTVTDRGIEPIIRCRELEELDLSHTAITDAALPQLAKLTKLKKLFLTGCNVTDAGVAQLKTLKQLESLEVSQTSVTPKAIEELRRVLPKLKPSE